MNDNINHPSHYTVGGIETGVEDLKKLEQKHRSRLEGRMCWM